MAEALRLANCFQDDIMKRMKVHETFIEDSCVRLPHKFYGCTSIVQIFDVQYLLCAIRKFDLWTQSTESVIKYQPQEW